MTDLTSPGPRAFEARISIDGGPVHHVVVTSSGAWVDGVPVSSGHPVVKALREWPATPEWVKQEPDPTSGFRVTAGYRWPWQPPKNHGTIPFGAER